MITRQSIVNEEQALETLRDLVWTYQEVAAFKMQKIRKGVLANRDYLADLSIISDQVYYSYRTQLVATENRPAKSAAVFVSANIGLYGSIVTRVFQEFEKQISQDKDVVIVIVGKLGKAYVEKSPYKREYQYFDFPDEVVALDSVKPLSLFLADFREVTVYHGRFESVITQSPAATKVSGEAKPPDKNSGIKVNYIFEPELKTVYTFFKSEIFTSLLIQALQENMLAKNASRMVAMDQAGDRISTQLSAVAKLSLFVKHRELARRQMDVYGAIRAWGRE
jgi:ATP synthase F1 gamma subunit